MGSTCSVYEITTEGKYVGLETVTEAYLYQVYVHDAHDQLEDRSCRRWRDHNEYENR